MTGRQFIKKTLSEMKIGFWEERFGILMARVEKDKFWVFSLNKDFTLNQIVEYVGKS